MNIISTILIAAAFIPLVPSTTHYERVEDPLPAPVEIKVKEPQVKIVHAIVSAYTSDPGETDSTPDITASGSRTRYGVVANNCLSFGTEVEIGGDVYTVEDRMNRRHGCEKFDLWMGNKSSALEWGVRRVVVGIRLQ